MSDPVVQLTVYLLAGVTLLMLIVLVVAWRVVRVRSRRKMALLVTKQHILNNHSLNDIDLTVTPLGDSTLKVTCLATVSTKHLLHVDDICHGCYNNSNNNNTKICNAHLVTH